MAICDGRFRCVIIAVLILFAMALFGIPIISIYVGAEYLTLEYRYNNNSYRVLVIVDSLCPVQPTIPLFLIIIGSITLVLISSPCFLLGSNRLFQYVCGIVYLFILLSFVGCTFWGTYLYASTNPEQNGNPLDESYCYPPIYAACCIQVFYSYLLLLLIVIGFCWWRCTADGGFCWMGDVGCLERDVRPRAVHT